MSEENKALARRVAGDIVNPGNVDAVAEIYAPHYVLHDPSTPEEVHGVEGIREFYETVLNAFPDTEISIEELIAEGDKVVMRWTSRGTHHGEFMGLPPSSFGTVQPRDGRAPGHRPRSESRTPDRQTLGTVGRIRLVPELPHHPQRDPPIPLREAADFPQHGAYGLISQRLHQLLIEERQVVFRVQEP